MFNNKRVLSEAWAELSPAHRNERWRRKARRGRWRRRWRIATPWGGSKLKSAPRGSRRQRQTTGQRVQLRTSKIHKTRRQAGGLCFTPRVFFLINPFSWGNRQQPHHEDIVIPVMAWLITQELWDPVAFEVWEDVGCSTQFKLVSFYTFVGRFEGCKTSTWLPRAGACFDTPVTI